MLEKTGVDLPYTIVGLFTYNFSRLFNVALLLIMVCATLIKNAADTPFPETSPIVKNKLSSSRKIKSYKSPLTIRAGLYRAYKSHLFCFRKAKSQY